MFPIKYRNYVTPSMVSKTFFDDLFNHERFGLTEKTTTVPSVNISENASGFELEMAVPGLEKTDFNVSVENNVLTIHTEKKQNNEATGKNYTRKEFSYQAFKRSFSLPEAVDGDAVSATYDKGVLTITIPKKEEVAKNKTKQIAIA